MTDFCAWVKTVANSDAGKKSRLGPDLLPKKFWTEAVPLSRFFVNQPPPEGARIQLARSGRGEDAVMLVPGGTKKEIQIVTTYDIENALTDLHMKEFGDAPVYHEIQTREDLARWQENKERVLPIAVNAILNIEIELAEVVKRIKAKVNKNYSPGMMLFVYSYLDLTEEQFSPDEIRVKILTGLSSVPLDSFSEIFLGQPRRVIQIK